MGLESLIGSAAGPIIGGMIGAGEQSASREQALALAQQSVSDLMAIGVPSQQAQQIVLQKYQSAGQLTPDLEQTIKQGSSELNNISTNPNDTTAQEQALKELQGIGENGGMRLSDMATQNQALGQVRDQSRGANEAIEQKMREQNQFGGGAELASKLSNQQNAATQSNQIGLGTNATAQDRALQAIMGSGQLGNTMQSTQFNQQAQKAQAQNAINQFNAQNAQAVQQRNIAAQNQAKGYNLSNNQNVSNANTGLTNQQETYNKGLSQQNYENQLQKAGMAANARSGVASNILGSGDAAAKTATGIGQGVGQAFNAYGQDQTMNKYIDKKYEES